MSAEQEQHYVLTNVKTGDQLGVFQHHDRKAKALCLQQGSVIYTLAYFRNKEEVARFDAFIAGFPDRLPRVHYG